jgi:hypothetical protein
MMRRQLVTAITAMALTAVLPMAAFQQPTSPNVSVQDPPTRPVLTVNRAAFCEAPPGPLVRIPSQSAPDGVQVRLVLPAVARYPEGAPIVVHSPAGPSVDRVNACLREQGFVEVLFQCPTASDGRLMSCSEALADVLAFATGQIRSLENRFIGGYAGAIKALTANVGIVGWSAGVTALC